MEEDADALRPSSEQEPGRRSLSNQNRRPFKDKNMDKNMAKNMDQYGAGTETGGGTELRA